MQRRPIFAQKIGPELAVSAKTNPALHVALQRKINALLRKSAGERLVNHEPHHDFGPASEQERSKGVCANRTEQQGNDSDFPSPLRIGTVLGFRRGTQGSGGVTCAFVSRRLQSPKGEFEFLRRLLPQLPRGREMVVGPGHDAARVRVRRGEWLLTVDAQTEGVHFRLPWLSLPTLGRRSFRVAASDISAMGGTPRFALVDCGVPRDVSLDAVYKMELGLMREAAAWGATIVGGNLHRAQELSISITVVGEAPKRRLDRGGARPGDLVLVSGPLGDSALAVHLLSRGNQCPPALLRRWQLPPRRDELGRRLAERGFATAMIDLSDGLAQDLSHICVESSVGAEVFAAKIPLSRPYRRYSGGDLSFALAGGEDYELLFTAPPKRLEAICKAASAVGCEVHVVGHVVRGRGVVVRDAAGKEIDLHTAGFDHFARR